MKRLIAGSIAGIVLASSSALAADMGIPLRTPPPPPPPVGWTGCYLDGGVGYGMDNVDQNLESNPGFVPVTQTLTAGGRGWLGRLGGGCDYQFGLDGLGNFVIGAFGDYDVMNIHRTFAAGATALAGDLNESGAWTVGGRIGYLVTPALLSYLDGGYTQTRFDQVNFSGLVLGTSLPGFTMLPHTYHGWFLGGGTEYAFNFDWIPIRGLFWRNEYRFSSYQAADLPILSAGVPTTSAVHLQPYLQTITSSLVWRFNWWGGPTMQ